RSAHDSEAHAHALTPHDSGVRVVVGLREGSSSWSDAEEAGLEVKTIAEAVRAAPLASLRPPRPVTPHPVSLLLPDESEPQVSSEPVEPSLEPDATVLFAHGFNILYGRIAPAAGHDVVAVAPMSARDR